MLSTSPNAFPTPPQSIPTQQQSRSQSSSNPLVDLIRTEKDYIETLKLIDSQIAPIWMKQMASAAPDFSEQLTHAHAIYVVNKRFCLRLVKVAGDPRAMRELGDILMQWVDIIEVPYASYFRNFIIDIDRRQDITDNPALRACLDKIAPSSSGPQTLKKLFDAPLERVQYYKSLYNRLLQSTRPGRADHGLLLRANQRIDTLIQISKNALQNGIRKAAPTDIPVNQYQGSTSVSKFLEPVDCSKVMDLFKKAPTVYRPPQSHGRIIMRDDFVPVENKATRLHLALSVDELFICRCMNTSNTPSYELVYPPIAVKDITVKSMDLERELLGEYLVHFNLAYAEQMTLRIASREKRNAWLGVSATAPSDVTLKSKSLATTVKQQLAKFPLLSEEMDDKNDVDDDHHHQDTTHDDIFALYGGHGDDDDEKDNNNEASTAYVRRNAFRDTIMGLYDGGQLSFEKKSGKPAPSTVDEDGQDLANIAPRSAKLLSRVPTATKEEESKEQSSKEDEKATKADMQSAPVKMTYIEPAVHKMTLSTNKSKEESTASTTPVTAQMTSAGVPILPRSSSRGGSASRPLDRTQQQQSNGVANTVQQTLRSAMTASIDSSTGSVSSNATDYSMMRESSSTGSTEASSSSVDRHQQQQKPNQVAPSPHPSSSSAGSPITITPLPRTSSKHTGGRMPTTTTSSPRMATNIPQRQASLSHSIRSVNSPTMTHAQPSPHNSTSSPSKTSLQIDTRSTSSGLDDLASPPQSPGAYANATKQVLYRHGRCDVFHWKGDTWYAAQGRCGIQVRVTNANRSCISILLLESGQLYLNAWIFPTTMIQLQGDTDVCVSVYMGTQMETYLIHFERRADAVELENVLQYAHRESIKIWGSAEEQQQIAPPPSSLLRSTSLVDPEAPPPDSKTFREEAPQTLKPLMQCKCKLFAQQEHAAWNSLGSVSLRISLQEPSNKMHIYMENGKTKLVSSVVQSCNVERFGPKRVSFLLTTDRSSMIYMINLKEERTATKIYEYIKTKNAQNGW
ncbi:hypothetical protein O0I10_007314 [Lichtheimia ornata]|uniref:DH domain-containing protein n=1 Tax=Lichtheimia ornata TaxID=688661 RepID=A0AAD7V187_9FUNG|nr:uncharacterized protein O0I10_007314 [Lichtheimia ornata]KAJ8656980.1 hypothetical protein O0I10_007314 [Lichtheimia ornata]